MKKFGIVIYILIVLLVFGNFSLVSSNALTAVGISSSENSSQITKLLFNSPEQQDTTPPTIWSVTRSPELVTEGTSPYVYANITDQSEIIAELVYSIEGQNGTATMEFGNGVHGARLPSGSNGTRVEYTVGATDSSGNVASSEVFSYVVGDLNPTAITFTDIRHHPSDPTPEDEVEVTGRASASSGVSEVILSYHVNISEYEENISMIINSNDDWIGYIPQLPNNTHVSYELLARDNNGIWSASNPREYIVLEFSENSTSLDLNLPIFKKISVIFMAHLSIIALYRRKKRIVNLKPLDSEYH